MTLCVSKVSYKLVSAEESIIIDEIWKWVTGTKKKKFKCLCTEKEKVHKDDEEWKVWKKKSFVMCTRLFHFSFVKNKNWTIPS